MKKIQRTAPLRVALVSVTMGEVQRGYERLFRDLFELLRYDVDMTLIKGSGPTMGKQERVPLLSKLARRPARLLPFKAVAGSEYKQYKADCLAFALGLLPELIAKRFDVVHFLDLPLGYMFQRLRPMLGLPQKLLMTNGCCMLPRYYPRVDCIHEITRPSYDAALQLGAPKELLHLLPIGIHAKRFERTESREALRLKYQVPADTFVILSVAAIKRVHKRIDHLLREAKELHGDFLIWLDGNPEDAELVEEARATLGTRCRVTLVPTQDVRDLYHLADVMIHTALEEAFGLSIVEALSTGLPVLTHDSPHFQWLTGGEEVVDMSAPGALAQRLNRMMHESKQAPEQVRARAQRVRERFDWQMLKPAYIRMYQELVPN